MSVEIQNFRVINEHGRRAELVHFSNRRSFTKHCVKLSKGIYEYKTMKEVDNNGEIEKVIDQHLIFKEAVE